MVSIEHKPRRRWLVAGIVVATLVVLGAGVFFFTRGSGGPAVSTDGSPSSSSSSASATSIALPDIKGIPQEGLYLLVVAERGACWSGYLGSQEIEDCGHQAIGIGGDPAQVSANGRLKATAPEFAVFELYLVNDGTPLAAARTSGSKEAISVSANP